MCLPMHNHQEGSFQDHNQENKSGEEELRCTVVMVFSHVLTLVKKCIHAANLRKWVCGLPAKAFNENSDSERTSAYPEAAYTRHVTFNITVLHRQICHKQM